MDPVERRFANGVANVRLARRFVVALLEDAGLDDLCDTAALLASEIVSNAMLHANSDVLVRVSQRPDQVTVEVLDRSPVLPVRKHYGNEAGTGRGILLVETLASRWGAERVDHGKRVWFSLDVLPPAPSAYGASTAVTVNGDEPLDLDALAAAFGDPGDKVFGDDKGPRARCLV
jgi:anti-sigma regulatory factor (Ser/Thr protein kinase)